MVALTIRTRSRVARKRPNKVAVGRMLTVAVFGMFILWWGGDARTINSLTLIYVYQIPMATRLFAWQHARHCNDAAYEVSTDSKKAARRRPLLTLEPGYRAYSAACLRGGSRAPESWMSATW